MRALLVLAILMVAGWSDVASAARGSRVVIDNKSNILLRLKSTWFARDPSRDDYHFVPAGMVFLSLLLFALWVSSTFAFLTCNS